MKNSRFELRIEKEFKEKCVKLAHNKGVSLAGLIIELLEKELLKEDNKKE